MRTSGIGLPMASETSGLASTNNHKIEASRAERMRPSRIAANTSTARTASSMLAKKSRSKSGWPAMTARKAPSALVVLI